MFFQELFDDQQRVVKLRKQVQRQYPKKRVEELVAWLNGAQALVDTCRIVQELKTSPNDCGDFALKRRQLFASRDDILALASLPEHVKVNSAILDEFLGGQCSVLVVDDVDCAAARRQFEEWFTRLQAATRHSTAMAHALQTKLAEGGKSLLGSDASTASALSLQWSAMDQALMEEERLLDDKTCLQVVQETVRCAVEAADELRAYFARSKEDWLQMDRLQPLLEHFGIFPDLASDDSFLQRLADVADLPLVDGVAADEQGGPWEVTEIGEANVREFRLLCRKAHKLQGNMIPIFIVHHGRVFAKYSFDGLLSLDIFQRGTRSMRLTLTRCLPRFLPRPLLSSTMWANSTATFRSKTFSWMWSQEGVSHWVPIALLPTTPTCGL